MTNTLTRSLLVIVLFSSSLTGCYMPRERDEAIVQGIDLDETLKVAEAEIEENKFGTVLTLWAIRDQELSPDQAERISVLYFENIERIDSESQKSRGFSVWHLTWGISNMFRHGDDGVRLALKLAYDDAALRVDALDSDVATQHFYAEKLTMGDVHFGGRSYSKSHLVVPGNEKYIQSFEEYEREQEKN